ncbi:MAG: hypothetical protein WC497_03155 [Patescibacteria group bacterium]
MQRRLFILVLLCLAAASVITTLTVRADSLSGNDETGLTNKDLRTARTDVQNSKQFFRDAKINWEKARDAYQEDPSASNLESAKKYAVQLIKQAIDVFDKHYFLLAARLKNSTGLAEAERATMLTDLTTEQVWLQTQRVAISETNDPAVITDIANRLNTYRTEKSVFVKKVVGVIVSSRIQTILTQMNDATARVDDDVTILTALQKDTGSVTSPRADFALKLAAAKEKYQLGHDGFASLANAATVEQDFESALAKLRESGEKLTDAKTSLDQIIAELKKVKASRVGGNGKLSVTGEGSFVISASEGTVTIAAGKTPTLEVFDRAGDCTVETQGAATKIPAGRKTSYSGFTQATITGTDFLLLYTGATTELTAAGTGRAYLKGTGTFQAVPDGVAESFADEGGVIFNLTQ